MVSLKVLGLDITSVYMTLCDEYNRLKKRSLSEWKTEAATIRSQVRGQVRKHGEVAALAGFFGGILVVVFFQIFCWIVFLLFVTSSVIWLKAPDGE